MQYISLDGNSLTSTDLVNLGRGLYKIKVLISKFLCSHGWFVVIFDLMSMLMSLCWTFSSWLRRQKKKLCNQENFWTPSSKKTKVIILIKSGLFNVIELLQDYSISELSLYWLLILCLSSCLWNHHWFWQICSDSHPRQQAEVKTLYRWRFGCSFFCMCRLMDFLPFLFHRELQENLVRSHSAGRKLIHL